MPAIAATGAGASVPKPSKAYPGPPARLRKFWLASRAGYVTAAIADLQTELLNPKLPVTQQVHLRADLADIHWLHDRGERAREHVRIAVITDPTCLQHPRLARQWLRMLLEERRIGEAESFTASHTSYLHAPHHVSTTLAAAEPGCISDEARLSVFARLLMHGGHAPITRIDPGRVVSLANITTPDASWISIDTGPQVSVIVPLFNAADTLDYAMRSLLRQTYQNLQILVVDDCSTDASAELAQRFVEQDERVELIRLPANVGNYAAKNHVLPLATGELVTVRDSDDWSHPDQIAVQVAALQGEPTLAAAFTQWVRVTHHLVAQGDLARSTPSLMMRTQRLRDMGGWQEVRVGADTELVERLALTFGDKAVVTIEPSVPLALAGITERNLTRDGARSIYYRPHVMGARGHYSSAHQNWYASSDFDGQANHDGARLDFVVPRILEGSPTAFLPQTHADIVWMSDLTPSGGTTAVDVEEISALANGGFTIGVMNHPAYPDNVRKPIDGQFWDLFNAKQARLLTVGEDVSCDLLVVVNPASVVALVDEMPKIRPRQAVLVLNQTPSEFYDDESPPSYDLADVLNRLAARFDVPFTVVSVSEVRPRLDSLKYAVANTQ